MKQKEGVPQLLEIVTQQQHLLAGIKVKHRYGKVFLQVLLKKELLTIPEEVQMEALL
jgi:hypothetical protein